MNINLPKIISHRGASAAAPENTLASIRLAAKRGATWIEVDVMATADDNLIIHHDLELERCTNGTGPILLKTLAEIQKLDAGRWFSKEYSAEPVPSLQQVIELVSEPDLGLNLEIKAPGGWGYPTARLVVKELKKNWPSIRPLVISSFQDVILKVIQKELPNVALGVLSDPIPYNWRAKLAKLNAYSLHCQWQFLTKQAVQEVKQAGYKVLAYTVNESNDAQALFAMGVDSIITDYPGEMVNFFKEENQNPVR